MDSYCLRLHFTSECRILHSELTYTISDSLSIEGEALGDFFSYLAKRGFLLGDTTLAIGYYSQFINSPLNTTGQKPDCWELDIDYSERTTYLDLINNCTGDTCFFVLDHDVEENKFALPAVITGFGPDPTYI